MQGPELFVLLTALIAWLPRIDLLLSLFRRREPSTDLPRPKCERSHVAKWAPFIVGGCLGSATGVIGASITDPEVGFPAWVDLTGIVAGFGLGVLATGLVLLGRATWSRQREQHRNEEHHEELRP